MAGGSGSVIIKSVPDGCVLLDNNNNVVSLPFSNAEYSYLRVRKDGEDVTFNVIPRIASGDQDITLGFGSRLFDFYMREDGSYSDISCWYFQAGEYEVVIDFVFRETDSSNTIGNIPMGELTFNGVQSVTYNGTDYTKLVVDGTNYPPSQ